MEVISSTKLCQEVLSISLLLEKVGSKPDQGSYVVSLIDLADLRILAQHVLICHELRDFSDLHLLLPSRRS